MPEDRRIALAALAVTAIVGVAAPVGTVVATNTHDRNRLRAEHAQADRAEVRKVLDDAAAAVGISYARFYAENVRQSQAPARHDPVRAYLRLRPELDRITRHYNVVALRLGREADASKRMSEVLATAREIVSEHATKTNLDRYGRKSSRPTRNLVEFARALDRYTAGSERFISAAHGVARSSTDP